MPQPRTYRYVRSNTPVYVNGKLLRNFARDPAYRRWQAIKNGTSHRVRAFNINPVNNKNGRIKKLFEFYIALNKMKSSNKNKPSNTNLNKLYSAAFGERRRNKTGTILMNHRHKYIFYSANRPRTLNVRRPPRLNI